MRVNIEVAPGELVDKISILEIKQSKIKDPEKLESIQNELQTLRRSYADIAQNKQAVDLHKKLKEVNENLWGIEDKIRLCEKEKKFDDNFIKLARSVYMENDKRARLKKQINTLFNSDIGEEKSYEEYQ